MFIRTVFISTMPMHHLIYAMHSDPGRVRRRNEDACAADGEHGIFVVCDGVGGAAGGEVASRLAADSFIAHVCAMQAAGISSEVGVHNGIEHANRAVQRQSRQLASLRGMATTLVALCFEFATDRSEFVGSVWLANVGDSRCYRLRDGALEQLTLDHSVVEEQVRAGEMTREQAELSPIRNVITRAVGSNPDVEADVQSLPVAHGDLYLLASDGLMRELADDQIAGLLKAAEVPVPTPGEPASSAALEAACARLIREANSNGGGDNVTCLLVYIL